MAKQILFDELHVTIFVPSGLGDRAIGKIRKTLAAGSLRSALRRALRDFILRHPELKPARIAVTG
jgi:hypothetical protein